MKPKLILRFFLLLTVITAGTFYLIIAGKASAARIKMQEQAYSKSVIAGTSNTDYIFFEAISKVFTFSVSK